MDMSQMLPLLMMMMNKNNAGGAQTAGAEPQAPDFEKVMENLNRSGGNPMDLLGGMQEMNPETARMFKLFTAMNNRDKKGGVPTDLLFEMMGGGNPQFKQMKAMMDMYQKMSKPKRASSVNTMSAEPLPINELKPIKAIAPDAIHKSMDEYLRLHKK